MSCVCIMLDVPNSAEHYLETSARLRGVSRNVLLKRLLEIVLKDQLMLSIFDDDDKPSEKSAKKTGKSKGRNMPPRDHLYDSLVHVSSSVPMRRPMNYRTKKYTPTRSEMEDDLRQAVLNTGGELSEKQ